MNRNGRRNRRSRRDGFTLMEVLLVLAILVILGSLVGYYFTGMQDKSYVSAAKTQIGYFEKSIQAYRLDVTQFPKSLNDLYTAPNGVDKWDGPYVPKKIPKDPWGNDYIYKLGGDGKYKHYEIRSLGPDGADGGGDDIINE